MPVCAVHAPCLLFTQRVWGTEPWGKLERSAEMAARGRRRGGRRTPAVPLAAGLRPRLRRRHRGPRGVDRHRVRGREHVPVAGLVAARHARCTCPAGTRPSEHYANTTIDLSHAAIAPLRPGRDGRAARRPAAAHPPHRRHRLGQGRAPGAGPRRRWAPASFLAPPGRHRLRRRDRARDQHPQVRHPRGARARPARVAGVRARALRGERRRDRRARTRRGRRPGAPGHPGGDPRRGPASSSPPRVRAVRRSARSPPRPASTRRWCTTTSAPRTTCSSPRSSCRSTRARCSRRCRGRARRRGGAVAPRVPVGLGRPRACRSGCSAWSAASSSRAASG